MKRTITHILTAVAITMALGTITLASTIKPSFIPKPDYLPGPDPTLQEEKGTRNLLVDQIIPYVGIGLIGVVGGLSVLFLIIGGIRFATMYGNEEAVTKAKTQITYALVGFLIALLSYTIVTIVSNVKVEGNIDKTPIEKAPIIPSGEGEEGSTPIENPNINETEAA